MFKKCSIFLGILLLGAQLAPPAGAADALQQRLQGLPASCFGEPGNLDSAGLARLLEFYRARAFQPAWESAAQLDSLALQLEQLADDGLNPASYQLSAIRQLAARPATDAQSADCADIRVSHAYLQALHDLSRGRLAQDSIEPLWHSTLTPPPSPLPRLSPRQRALDDLPGAFADARPGTRQYQQLRQSYARLRQAALPDWPRIPGGPLLKPGMADPRLPLLDQRLAGEGYLPAASADPADLHYSPPRVAAVQAFQRQHGLQADGILGAGTLSELNISAAQRRDQLRINLERWRWLSANLDAEILLVDISAARLNYYREHVLLWQTRLQVGRAARPTPLLKSVLTRLTLNPSWTVPPTILQKDKLPAIRADLNFLAEHRLRVLDLQGNELDPATIDWQRPGAIMLRQDPGPQNPLGKMALRFPNPFSVYLHDTPSIELFEKSPRTFSSGCVRVEGVSRILELLLSPAERLQVDALLASGNTVEYRLPRRVPILLGYWTAEADAAGQPLYRPDIYGHDARLLAALDAATR
ncbi:L,D-transpeptidase family protein [Pseudomonas sp. N040]|uniref:L,D-transpeptidase family protein n=1 Tax=Pseudomonas sp. N040 TaxID=2785325 RepID=UPI0018A2BE63|nr:L,D-transpeptidase family protein [Pseudomonas sp. N040]MBF7730086.1 L,D-transpeptidase family protein [Pseudomonas sp. N040]MBW7013728.1 L,D-transpeptidase family protein [Pseudomonas sp. N040]